MIDILEKDERIALANSKKGYLQPCDIWELEDKVKDEVLEKVLEILSNRPKEDVI